MKNIITIEKVENGYLIEYIPSSFFGIEKKVFKTFREMINWLALWFDEEILEKNLEEQKRQ